MLILTKNNTALPKYLRKLQKHAKLSKNTNIIQSLHFYNYKIKFLSKKFNKFINIKNSKKIKKIKKKLVTIFNAYFALLESSRISLVSELV